MPRNRPELEAEAHTPTVSRASAGRLLTRAGAALALTATPLALATLLSILADAPTLVAGLDAAATSASGPLAVGGGVGWLFHVAVLGLLAGTWTLGAGLVVAGLAD